MKKLKLKALELGASEVLTREQLKNTTGGGTPFACSCSGIPKPGGIVAWLGDYDTTIDMVNDINTKCGSLGGTCTQLTTTPGDVE